LKEKLAYILAIIYASYDKDIIDKNIISQVAKDVFSNFLNLLGVLPLDQRNNLKLSLNDLVNNFIDDFINNDDHITELVAKEKLKWKVNNFIDKAKQLNIEQQEDFINNAPVDIKNNVITIWNNVNQANYYNQFH
tara:strand:+ start:259 stop:663 length:405 start_codon:yes stop_codon:yes gene_type:complete